MRQRSVLCPLVVVVSLEVRSVELGVVQHDVGSTPNIDRDERSDVVEQRTDVVPLKHLDLLMFFFVGASGIIRMAISHVVSYASLGVFDASYDLDEIVAHVSTELDVLDNVLVHERFDRMRDLLATFEFVAKCNVLVGVHVRVSDLCWIKICEHS